MWKKIEDVELIESDDYGWPMYIVRGLSYAGEPPAWVVGKPSQYFEVMANWTEGKWRDRDEGEELNTPTHAIGPIHAPE